MQCAPAFNYARSTHIASIVDDESVPGDPDATPQKKALFESDSLALDLRYVAEVSDGVTDSGVLPPRLFSSSWTCHKRATRVRLYRVSLRWRKGNV
jgi:hypothetical protein